MDDPLQCSTEVVLLQKSVYCPECTRNYDIFSKRHICSKFIRCNLIGEEVYEEQYNDNKFNTDIRAYCSVCEENRAKKLRARPGKCPNCGYEGRYKYSDTDKRCPACVTSSIDDKILVNNTVAQSTFTNNSANDDINESAKDVYVVNLTMKLKKNDPVVENIRWILLEIMTENSMLTDEWIVDSIFFSGFSGDISQFAQDISAKLRDKKIMLISPDKIEWKWLKHIYTKYTDDHRTNWW